MLVLSSSRPLPFVAAIGHPPLQKKSSPFPRAVYTLDIHVYQVSMSRERAECFCTTYKASVMLGGGRLHTSTTLCTTKPYRCAYYDRSTTTVREQTFDGYCTRSDQKAEKTSLALHKF